MVSVVSLTKAYRGHTINTHYAGNSQWEYQIFAIGKRESVATDEGFSCELAAYDNACERVDAKLDSLI